MAENETHIPLSPVERRVLDLLLQIPEKVRPAIGMALRREFAAGFSAAVAYIRVLDMVPPNPETACRELADSMEGAVLMAAGERFPSNPCAQDFVWAGALATAERDAREEERAECLALTSRHWTAPGEPRRSHDYREGWCDGVDRIRKAIEARKAAAGA